MDPIFDKFGRLVRSWFSEDEDLDFSPDGGDSDYKSAWDELEDFLKSDSFEKEMPPGGGSSQNEKPRTGTPEYLRRDYELLNVSFGSGITEVKKAYKIQILKYHPDRFATDPEGQKTATRKAAAINEAFQRIETHFETAL